MDGSGPGRAPGRKAEDDPERTYVRFGNVLQTWPKRAAILRCSAISARAVVEISTGRR